MRTGNTRLPKSSSLADLIAATRSDTSMWKGRRQIIARGLLVIARLLGSRPSELPADPRRLLPHAERDLLTTETGRAKWYLRLSDLRAAVERWGLSEAPGRYAPPLTPEWQATADRLVDERTRQTLARFMNFLSAQGVPPEAVDDRRVAAYAAVTEAEGLVRRPSVDLRAVRVAWNRAQLNGKPHPPVSLPGRKDVYAFEPEVFPFSFRMELECYLAFRARDVPVSGRTPLRPASLRSIRHAAFAYVSALVHAGHAPGTLVSLASVATPEMVKIALTFLAERCGRRRTKQMTHVTSFVAAIGRMWVDVPAEIQAELDGLRKAFGWRHEGVARSNRILISQFDDDARTDAMLSVPSRLVALACREALPTRGARMYMTALVIEMLLTVPLRPAEMLAIDVEHDIVVGPDGPQVLISTRN